MTIIHQGVLSSLLYFCTGLLALCQPHLADSLEQRLGSLSAEARVDVLNQLTYEFITVDNSRVLLYNAEAIELSHSIGYVKGEAKAFTYKGVYEYLSGQLPPAHENLHKGLALSKEVGDQTNIGYTLLQLGNLSLEEVETDSALFYLNSARAFFKDGSDSTTLSKIYRNLSSAYGQNNQVEKQSLYLDSAIHIRQHLPGKALLIEALLLKANNLVRAGRVAAAERLLAEAEEIARTNMAYEESRYDFFHLSALILFQKGEIEPAMVLADSARNYYFRVSLIRKYVTLLIDIGRVFSHKGEYEIALDNLYPALELSNSRGFDAETYYIRTRIGWIHFRFGDYQNALAVANEALNSNPKKQLLADVGSALLLKGLVLTELDQLGEANLILDSAQSIFLEIGDDRGYSDVLRSVAYLKVKKNDFNSAVDLYTKSIAIAQEIAYRYGLAHSYWGLADVYFRLKKIADATTVLEEAERFALSIQANEVLIKCYITRRDILSSQKQFENALKYSMMANQLNDSLHKSDLTRRFVNLEKIHQIEQRDRNIATLEQEKLLAKNQIDLQNAQLSQQFILLVAGLVVLILFGILTFVYYRFYRRIKLLNTTVTDKNQRIQAQSDKLKEVNVELKRLYVELSEQNDEIQVQSKELAISNENIKDLNRNLEQLVEEKTIELRTTNEQLVRYNGELLQFSYTVSHNLRGPVARLLGLTELAKTEIEILDIKKWIELIYSTSLDLDLIISDLSKLLELRNGPNQYRESIVLKDEWNRSINLLGEGIKGDELITCDFSEVEQLISVRARIQSILYNLLSNAIKFRSPERPLIVQAIGKKTDSSVVIIVTDNGLGFDTSRYKEDLFKLYKRFHTHVEGRGLGLYLIKAQLEALQGTIEVDSIPGKGTTFTITIPVRVQDQLSSNQE